MTPAMIEPATFRFVAQHLNHCTTAVPRLLRNRKDNSDYFTFSPVRMMPMEALNLLSGNGWRPSPVVDAIDALPFQPSTQSK